MRTLVGVLASILCLALSGVPHAQEHVGCFADNQSAHYWGTPGRMMAGHCMTSDARSQPRGNCAPSAPMTVDICVRECGARGFDFAGVQFGQWCFCGASPGGAKSSRCNMPCVGNPAENCGGSFANNVFRTRAAPQARSEPTKDRCAPRATVEMMEEGTGRDRNTYQVIVINNDCPVRVTFKYLVTQQGSAKAQELSTACAPAKTARFVAMGTRTSSISMSTLTATQQVTECK